MKYVKMLGLAAAAAMALMSFFGASSASAGVICETNQVHCAAGWSLPVNTELTWSLKSGTHATLKAAFSEVTCKESHVLMHITRAGAHNVTPKAKLTTLSFSNCTCGSRTAHVSSTALGEMEVSDTGTTTSFSTSSTIQCTGLASCKFGTVAAGTDVGKTTDSGETGGAPVLDAEATLTYSTGEGDSSQFVCAGFGDTGTWTASYQLTPETKLYRSTT